MRWQAIATVEVARARAAMLDKTRHYFSSRGVLEVETPTLIRRATTDPNTHSFPVQLDGQCSYLHTSPEYFMKRLLASGYPDIYQICKVFRAGESGRHHLTEFTMVEWYRLDCGLRLIMQQTVEMISLLIASVNPDTPDYLTYSQAFDRSLSLDPMTAPTDALADAVDADAALRETLGTDRDSWLDLAMANRVAQSFKRDRLTVLFHYPASQASLARLCPDNRNVADRFEVYFGSIELANGFVELADADEQLQRFEIDRKTRALSGTPDHDVDEYLIEALRAGLPACAGVALGFDRLLMVEQRRDDVRDIVSFIPGADRVG